MASAHDRENMPHDYSAMVEEMMEMINELADSVADIKTIFDAHTHNADGSEAGAYFTSPPRSDAADVTAGTASTVAAAPTKISH